MIKKLLILLALGVGSVQAESEIILNFPTNAFHSKDTCGNTNCNENLLNDGGASFGVSYRKDYYSFSVNTVADNSFRDGRSFYFATELAPVVAEYKNIKLRTGATFGIATNYKQMSNSGVIPFAGAIAEISYDRLSLAVIGTPSYKLAPSSLITMFRVTAYKF